MTIGRALWRPLVPGSHSPTNSYLWLSKSFQRSAADVARSPGFKRQPTKLNTIRRFIPDEVKQFVKTNGKLLTTPENRDFILENKLEPDNGRMICFSGGLELSRAASACNATIGYSPRHVIHPFDLRYFDPRGHPLAPMKRAQYVQKTREKPMWIFVTCVGSFSAVVRTSTGRRLTKCIYEELHRFGYPSHDGVASKIRGTLWITIHDAVKAATYTPERFALLVARALVRHCKG
ncbi:hypothetical protein NOR_04875 [Metarhizium rileyi]|uniref:Uncharacterized protein n=1 Tax=Metarhizium rileyi (strain RCEF 4871) TaxID=1649241 RepID=A0A167DR23_METRR|nr:hypothetical protein NOR_04875 [Metarhizium rileyi RCEF 4871]